MDRGPTPFGAIARRMINRFSESQVVLFQTANTPLHGLPYMVVPMTF